MTRTRWLIASSLLAGCAWKFFSARKTVSSPLAANTPAASPPLPFRGNPESRVFHLPACRYYHARGCVESFASREAALGADFKPCSLCSP